MYERQFRVCLLRNHPKLDFLGVYNSEEIGGTHTIHEKEFIGHIWDPHPKLKVIMKGAEVRLNFSSKVSSKSVGTIRFRPYESLIEEKSTEDNFNSPFYRLLKLLHIKTSRVKKKPVEEGRTYSFYNSDYKRDVLDIIVLIKTLRKDHPEVFASFSKSIEDLVASIHTLAHIDEAHGSFHKSLRDGVRLVKEYYKFAVVAKEEADEKTRKRVQESVKLHNKAVKELTEGMERINSL